MQYMSQTLSRFDVSSVNVLCLAIKTKKGPLTFYFIKVFLG